MSVIVTVRTSGDPAKFQEQAAAQSDVIARIIGIAKSHGLIAHRWYAGDGEYMAIDEWPDGESFHAFFEEAGPEIGPFMEASGVTAPPEPKVWRKFEIGDEVGWED